MTTAIVNKFENISRSAVILARTAGFEIDFREHGKFLGTIPYYEKSIHYVEDAAYNFIQGILTKETIDLYKKD